MPLQFGKVGPRDLDADGGLYAGCQHIDACLDGHRPGVGEAGDLYAGVERRNQLVERAAPVGDDLPVRILDVHGGPLLLGFSMIVVSIMSIGAGSVAVSARPILPKT